MEFKITGMGDDTVASDGSVIGSKGGTELMKERLMDELPDNIASS